MLIQQVEPYLDDYLGSEHLLFLNTAIKEQADGILRTFFQRAGAWGATSLETLKAKTVEAVLLEDMGNLALPADTKRNIPDLFSGFFNYLKETGRFPGAGSWQLCVESVQDRFHSSLREDGSQRGQTFKKNYSDVGRNDPCPCGSGLKFKKCCGPRIGM